MVNKYHGGGADIDKKVPKRDWSKIPKTLGLSDAEKKAREEAEEKKIKELAKGQAARPINKKVKSN